MSVKTEEVTIYKVACDTCGEFFEDYEGDQTWESEIDALDAVESEEEWQVLDGNKHMCVMCFEKVSVECPHCEEMTMPDSKCNNCGAFMDEVVSPLGWCFCGQYKGDAEEVVNGRRVTHREDECVVHRPRKKASFLP